MPGKEGVHPPLGETLCIKWLHTDKIYVCIVCMERHYTCRKSILLQVAKKLLASWVNYKLLTYKQGTQWVGDLNCEQCTSSMATTRTETTHGPTSSMAVVMRLFQGQKKMVRVFLSVHAICLSTNDFNNGTTYVPQRLQWSLARGETGCNRECLCIQPFLLQAHVVVDRCAVCVYMTPCVCLLQPVNWPAP